ncbi:hypothetical protein KM043_001027 [Ampulex compressa]|nr:hypothetical protein KM043_001027 [Ampulex compressa]
MGVRSLCMNPVIRNPKESVCDIKKLSKKRIIFHCGSKLQVPLSVSYNKPLFNSHSQRTHQHHQTPLNQPHNLPTLNPSHPSIICPRTTHNSVQTIDSGKNEISIPSTSMLTSITTFQATRRESQMSLVAREPLTRGGMNPP